MVPGCEPGPLSAVPQSVLFLVIDSLLVFVGLARLLAALRLRRDGAFTVGRVVALDERPASDGGLIRIMSIEFTDSTAQKHLFQDSVANGVDHGPVGAAISVLYDRQNPQRARVSTFDHLWLVPLILIGVDGVSLVLIVSKLCQS